MHQQNTILTLPYPTFVAAYEESSEYFAGGMGEVVLVRKRDDNSLYVKKSVLPHEDPKKREQNEKLFMREMGILKELGQHPNIQSLHAIVIEEDASFAFLSEYIEGPTLHEVIKEKRHTKTSPSIPFVFRILKQITSALHHAYTKGIIHRDIKPANMIFNKETQRAVLIDFGIGKFAEQNDDKNMDITDPTKSSFRGTVHYISYEAVQACDRGIKIDFRTDMYSLAVSGYELLTYASPFDESELMVIIGKKETGAKGVPLKARLALRKTLKKVPNSLIAIIEKNLHPKREKRYQSYERLLADLSYSECSYYLGSQANHRDTQMYLHDASRDFYKYNSKNWWKLVHLQFLALRKIFALLTIRKYDVAEEVYQFFLTTNTVGKKLLTYILPWIADQATKEIAKLETQKKYLSEEDYLYQKKALFSLAQRPTREIDLQILKKKTVSYEEDIEDIEDFEEL
ncbi:serine/threonine protein kinase [Candidatus Uabimicrobium sp. HlEnr_7]|uniref:serine/threonine protein kinase n=1 Tax=Candidatus Uabimicrobium helgolandensis TaxID=3095367 RepID=UPI003557DC4C